MGLKTFITDPTSGRQVEVMRDQFGVSRLRAEITAQNAIPVSLGGAVPDNPALLFVSKLKNSNGASDMRVNGSETPVVFRVPSEPLSDIVLSELRLVLSVSAIVFDGISFGSINTLTNGILINLVVNDGVYAELGTLRQNENLLEAASSAGLNIFTEFSGTNDSMMVSYSLGTGMILKRNSDDYVAITVRDNLTATSFKYFSATLYGARVT